MTPAEYRTALLSFGWTHKRASEALEIGKRTSLRYAKHGVPELSSPRIQRRLERLSKEK